MSQHTMSSKVILQIGQEKCPFFSRRGSTRLISRREKVVLKLKKIAPLQRRVEGFSPQIVSRASC